MRTAACLLVFANSIAVSAIATSSAAVKKVLR